MCNKKYIWIFTLAISFLIIISMDNATEAKAKTIEKPTYQLSPSSKPIDSTFLKLSTYNSQTKNYYMLRSYLEKLEKTKGGKLILNKGTYIISNVLYVPSNVTIQLEDGAKIVKGKSTGSSKIKPSKSIFQFIRPSKSKEENVYGKYEGEKNIKIIGKGNATIDLQFDLKSIGIIIGHNQNIVIDNIQFKNMNGGHFIELDASNNVTIKNSSFKFSKHLKGHDKEGINIDTPDHSTEGWSEAWSKFDKQPNNNVLIADNTFKELDRAVGTHKYSGGKLHNNVTIRHNKIQNMRSDAIRVMNWSNTIIEHNSISDVGNGKNNLRGILISGAKNPTIQYNDFNNVARAMQFIVWKNNGPGSQYKAIYNTLSDKNKKALKTNTVKNTIENFIRITNKSFGNYSNAEKIYLHVQNPPL
ncbi:right-handed parallel beta-helix repeat-containing protein [Rummeliibacillus pycnus]|uniref:right-handed parallel beta-helix repeat-containing protein n=1 Tax=Rummeliibacillus pycnus TaxID=101070 RepID=UPI003D28E00B